VNGLWYEEGGVSRCSGRRNVVKKREKRGESYGVRRGRDGVAVVN